METQAAAQRESQALTLVRALDYQGARLEVLEAGGERWVAAAAVEGALGISRGTAWHLIARDPEEFEGFVRRTDVAGEFVDVTPTTRPEGRPATLYLNFKGVLAVILKANRKRMAKPQVRVAVLAFRRWALETLEAAMLARPIVPPPTPPDPVPPPSLIELEAHRRHVLDALGRNGHNLPTPLMLAIANAIGLVVDPEEVDAARGQPMDPERVAGLADRMVEHLLTIPPGEPFCAHTIHLRTGVPLWICRDGLRALGQRGTLVNDGQNIYRRMRPWRFIDRQR